MRWNDRATHAPVVRQLHRHTGNRPSCHPIFPAVTMSCHRTRCKRLRVCKFDQYLESTGHPRQWSVWVHRENNLAGGTVAHTSSDTVTGTTTSAGYERQIMKLKFCPMYHRPSLFSPHLSISCVGPQWRTQSQTRVSRGPCERPTHPPNLHKHTRGEPTVSSIACSFALNRATSASKSFAEGWCGA
jgi:hypothetical protein